MKLLSLQQLQDVNEGLEWDIGMIGMGYHGTALLNSANGLPIFGMYTQFNDGDGAAGISLGATVYPVIAAGLWTGELTNDENSSSIATLGQETGVGPILTDTALTTTTADYHGFTQVGGVGVPALTTDGSVAPLDWLYGSSTDGTTLGVAGDLTTQGPPTGGWGLAWIADTSTVLATRLYQVRSQLFMLPLTI